MFSMSGYTNCLCLAQAGTIRHRDAFGAHYGLRLVFYAEGSLDGIKNFAVNPCAPDIQEPNAPKPFKCASDPSLRRASRPLYW